jgi:glycosyltransferase involved in cell wall biosynthesis
MKILVNDFAGHPFPMQLSRELARAGHTVLHTYFAANNTPKGPGALPDDPPGLALAALTIGRAFKKHAVISRRLTDAAYGKAVSERLRAFRPDVVLSANTPLHAQQLLLESAAACHAKFVFWLQDLLSAGVEFALRAKKLPFASAAAMVYARIEKRLLRQSDAIVCIAPEFRARLEAWKIPPAKTFVVENWASPGEVRATSHDNPWAREQGLAGKFCFLYSGTLGMKHKPELLLALAKHFESNPGVVTVAVAQGAGADWLRANARLRPEALRQLPFQPYERLSEVLGAADVLISLLNADCGAFAVPSKTLAYLCAGRPLLVAAPASNLAAQIVRRAGAGEVVAPGDAEALLAAAGRLYHDPAARSRYAANARAYAERTFRIADITRQFLDIFAFVLPKHAADVPEPASQCCRWKRRPRAAGPMA